MKKITEIRCSQLYRPMNCAGYLFFENLPPQPTNDAAEEGTAAGELLERKLTGQNIPFLSRNGRPFDNDMHFYTDEVKKIIDNTGSQQQSEITCENRIDWQTQSGIWIRGSYDISFIRDGKLYIDDLKYGFGHVEVKKNWQLLAYAIGRYLQLNTNFVSIVMRIHQPRPHHEDGTTRTWEISPMELMVYKDEIEQRMKAIASGYNALVTGPQCKYCPAAAVCPAIGKAVYQGVEFILNEFKQDEIDEKTIAEQLALFDRVSEILKIKQDSLKQLALDRLQNAKLIPGWTTEESYGNRIWKPFVSPKVLETLTGKKVTEEVMLSPAKVEKLGIPKELVKEYVNRPFLGNKLVRKDSTEEANKIFGKPKEGVTL